MYGKSPYIIHCYICVWEIAIRYSLLHLCMGNCHTLFIATFVYGRSQYIIHCYICVWETIHYSLLHLCMGNLHTLFIATFVYGRSQYIIHCYICVWEPYIIHCYICVWEISIRYSLLICVWEISIRYSLLHLCMGDRNTLFIATFVYGKSSYIKSKVHCSPHLQLFVTINISNSYNYIQMFMGLHSSISKSYSDLL